MSIFSSGGRNRENFRYECFQDGAKWRQLRLRVFQDYRLVAQLADHIDDSMSRGSISDCRRLVDGEYGGGGIREYEVGAH